MLDGKAPSSGIDIFDGRGIDQPELARKGREGVRKHSSDALQTCKVARAAVDRAPLEHLVQHRLCSSPLDGVHFGCGEVPHATFTSRATGGRPHRAMAQKSAAALR